MSRCYSCNKFAAMELCDSCFYAMNPPVKNREAYEAALSDTVVRSAVLTVIRAFKPTTESPENIRINEMLSAIEDEIDKLV